MSDLREALKKAILSENYDGAGAVGGISRSKPKKSKKSKKTGGFSSLSMLGPVENSKKLQSLVRQMINEEIASGEKGGFHGIHPVEKCNCDCHGGGMVGGMKKKAPAKKKLSPHLFPHNSAIKALKGIKFNSKHERQAVINHLATMYNHAETRPQNVKYMKEYIAQHV